MKNVDLTLLVPAFNEGDRIERNLQEMEKALAGKGVEYEIVVVDDGSRDDTAAAAARRTKAGAPVRVAKMPKNMGKGWALRNGFPETRGSYVAFLDADLDISPDQALNYYLRIRQDNVDVLIASKVHPDSRLNYPFHRRLVSWIYFASVWLLFGLPIHDTQTGLKIFRREVLEKVFNLMLVKRYAFDLELLVLAHAFGFSIHEAPVRIHFQRPWGRIRWRDYYVTAWDTAAIFYRLRILRYYQKRAELSGVVSPPSPPPKRGRV